MSQVKDKVKVAVRNCNRDSIDDYANPGSSYEDDFFKSMDSSFSSLSNKDHLELRSYLENTSHSSNSLDKYLTIKKIFKM